MNKELQHELEHMEAFFLLTQMQKENQPFRVPNNYFQNKKDTLTQISAQKQQFKVPTDYFDQLNESVMQKVDALEEVSIPKKRSSVLIQLRPYLAVAASLALLFSVFFLLRKSNEDLTPANAYQELYDDGSLSAFELAYVTDDAESYVFETLFDGYNSSYTEESIDLLFEDNKQLDVYDELFNTDDI